MIVDDMNPFSCQQGCFLLLPDGNCQEVERDHCPITAFPVARGKYQFIFMYNYSFLGLSNLSLLLI